MHNKTNKLLNIKNEMFLLGFTFLIVSSLLFTGIFLKLLYDNNMKSARNSLRECNSQIVIYTEGMFHENATVVELLSLDKTIINAGYGDPSAVIKIFEAIHRRNSNITYIYSGYEDGSLFINNYEVPVNFDSTTRPWYQAAADTDGVARLVYSDAATGVWLFSQCMKIVDSEGNMTGAICIDCSNESITKQLSTKYQYASQRSFIVNSGGTVLIHAEEEQINESISVKLEPDTWSSIVIGRNNYGEYVKDGVKAMAYFERIPETNFIVVTAIDISEVTSPMIRSMIFLFLLISFISVILGVLLCRILIRRFARPVMELGRRMQNLAAGEPEQIWDVSFSNKEINDIAESIEIIVKNIAKREEQKKAAEFLSVHDSMTGLYNRRFFEKEMERLDEKSNYPVCIICADINGLKLINDVFGHIAGDRLITMAASCLEKGCRAGDTLARIGGDEFGIILPRTMENEAKRVIRRIASYFPKSGMYRFEVSVSLGYALKTREEESYDDILHKADEMMYERKILESMEMKQRTIAHIIEAAEQEGCAAPLQAREVQLLDAFADALCPDSRKTLMDSYRLRGVGRCSVVNSTGDVQGGLVKHHTEMGYRILSAVEEYRSAAGCVLHYQEHWDGSGGPAGISGKDIPLLSRIVLLVEAYMEEGIQCLSATGAERFDPELASLLQEMDMHKKI